MSKFIVFLAAGCMFNVIGVAMYMRGHGTLGPVLVALGLVVVFTGVVLHAKSSRDSQER